VISLQVVVESSNSALEYGDLTVDENSPVNPDLHFDSQLMHLYVMTDKKVRMR
jgi:plexin A